MRRTQCADVQVSGRVTTLHRRNHRNQQLIALVAFALFAWCILAVVWPHVVPDMTVRLSAFGYAASAALFVGAGAMQLARSRLIADTRLRWSGAAMLVAGAGILLAGVLGSFAVRAVDQPHPAPMTRMLIVAPVLVVLVVGTGANAVRHASTALHLATAAILAHAAAGLLLSYPQISRSVRAERFDALWLVEGIVATAVWSAVALRLATRVRRTTTAPLRHAGWRALALGLMAVSEALYTCGLAGLPRADTFAAGFVLVAAALVFAVAAVGLREAFATTSRRTLLLADDLRDAQQRLLAAQERERERLHDARTALVGVLGATKQLTTATPGIRSGLLEQVIETELRRLTRLFDTEADEPVVEFNVAAALAPVLAAHRLAGHRVVAELDGCRGYGRPTALASVVANLLANTAQHAPGATASVQAVSDGRTVAVFVDDDGPGIPDAERELALSRGGRGATSPAGGSGLGLYTAATAMAAQGGSLRLRGRSGSGVRIVLTVPAAPQLAVITAKAS